MLLTLHYILRCAKKKLFHLHMVTWLGIVPYDTSRILSQNRGELPDDKL